MEEVPLSISTLAIVPTNLRVYPESSCVNTRMEIPQRKPQVWQEACWWFVPGILPSECTINPGLPAQTFCPF